MQVGKGPDDSVSHLALIVVVPSNVVAPLAKKLKAAYLKHGVAYRLSRFETGPNVGDWFVVVQYADQTAYREGAGSYCARPRMPTGLYRDSKVREEDSAENWSSISIFDTSRIGELHSE